MNSKNIIKASKITAIALSTTLLFGCIYDRDSNAITDTTTDTTTDTDTDTTSFPATLDEFNFTSSSLANSGATGETDLTQNGSQVITATINYDDVADTAINHDQGDSGTTTTVGNLKYSADPTKIDVGSLTSSFSLEAVIKVSDRTFTSDIDLIAYFEDDTNTVNYGGFKVYLEKTTTADTNLVKFKLYGTDSTNTDTSTIVTKNTEVKAVSTLTVDVWQHIMAVYDADTDTASLYIDGVLSNSVELEADKDLVYVTNPETSDDFTVLGGSSSSDKNFDGDVDNVATWNVALTADQVSERAAEFGF